MKKSEKTKQKKLSNKKNFILDTNVMLHDANCILNFQENDIYLPIVVLEELDKFKKGNEQINYNAREFVRQLDLLTSNDLHLKGASLGPDKGTLYIVTGDEYHERIAKTFPNRIPDHRILSCALTVAEKHPKMQTILVSKDVNLRMKARSLGIPVEDYINDKVINVDIFERSHETYEGIDPELIDKIYASPQGIETEQLEIHTKLEPNECFILKSERNSVMARFNPFTGKIKRVEKSTNFGIQPRNAEQSFAFEVLNDPDVKLVGLTGKGRQYPTQLSGGEQQRVAIARALANNPSVIIADEPTGNLDPARSLEIMSLLEKINDMGTTVLVVTHERELVNRFSKRVVAIESGRIISDASGGYYGNGR